MGSPPVISTDEWCGLAYLPDGTGSITEIVYRSHRDEEGKWDVGVSTYPSRSRPGEPYEAATVDFEPLGAVATDKGFIIAGDVSYTELEPDGNGLYRVSISKTDYPELLFELHSSFPVEEETRAMKLRNSYSSLNTTLGADDTTTLTSALASAYSRLSVKALSEGVLVQPVMVRYRLEDSAGHLLFLSSPRMMMATDADVRPVDVSLRFDTDSSILPGSVIAPGYRLRVRVPACRSEAIAAKVARLVVEMTPQIHFPDLSLPAGGRIKASPGQPLTLDAWLPGCSGTRNIYARRVISAVGADDALFSPVLTIERPFDTSRGESVQQICPRCMSVREEVALHSRYGATPGDPPKGELIARCRVPHSIFSPVATRSSGYTIMADPRVSLFPGHSLRYFTHTSGPVGMVEMVITIRFAGGYTQVVNYQADKCGRPLSISPLFVYPDPAATEAYIQAMGSDGRVYERTLQLTPCGGFAYCLNPEIEPFELLPAPEGVEFNVPPTVGDVVTYKGTILSSPTASPVAPVSTLSVDGPVHALLEAPRPSSGSWDSSSRPRLLTAGAGGIHSFSLKPDGTLTPPVLLDSRPVESAAAVAEVTTPADGSRVIFLAGGDLVDAGNGRVRTLRRHVDASMLAWNAPYGELCLILPGATRVEIYDVATGDIRHRVLPPVSHVLNARGHSRLTVRGTGYVSMDSEIPCDTRCRATFDLPAITGGHPLRGGYPRPLEVIIDVTGERLDGTIDIATSRGGSRYDTVSRLAFAGPLDAPLSHRITAPGRYRVRVIFDALVTPDTIIHPPSIIFDDRKLLI